MLLHIQESTTCAKYIQVYQKIKHMIQQRELQAHDRLPSKRQLAKENGLSLNTIINAYEQLLVEGYIYATERQGYYVAEVDFQVDLAAESTVFSYSVDTQLTYQFDLSQSLTDATIFPYKTYKRLLNDVIEDSPATFIASAPVAGHLLLRQALQRYLKQSRGVPCQWEQIIIGPSTHYLLQILLKLLPHTTSVGIENPGYHEALALFSAHPLKIYPIALDAQGLMTSHIQPDVQLICTTPNHQFPTGIIMPLERRQNLLKWAYQQANRWIIEDDYDSEYKFSGVPIPSLAHLDQQGKVIYMGSFSRILANGIRLSYMVLPSELLGQFEQIKSHYAPSVNSMIQLALAKFIQAGHLEKHLNRSRSFYKHKRDLLIQAIKHYDSTSQILATEAGLHILWKPSFTFDSRQLKQLLLQTDIKISTLADYCSPYQAVFDQYLFISFSSIPESQISELTALIYQQLKTTQITKPPAFPIQKTLAHLQ